MQKHFLSSFWIETKTILSFRLTYFRCRTGSTWPFWWRSFTAGRRNLTGSTFLGFGFGLWTSCRRSTGRRFSSRRRRWPSWTPCSTVRAATSPEKFRPSIKSSQELSAEYSYPAYPWLFTASTLPGLIISTFIFSIVLIDLKKLKL